MNNAKYMTRIALCAACICALSQITIPMPSGVPLTLQTFAVALAAGLLGTKRSIICVVLYLFIGAAGLPVFAGFTGGISRFAGPTGGFLIGFIPMAALCGIDSSVVNGGCEKSQSKWMPLSRVMAILAGVVACHAFGVAHFAFTAGVNAVQAFVTVSAPYIIKDAVCAYVAVMLAERIKFSARLWI
ncbi:MAG: biotin transporter BioY [Clostridia bacterium]|nr:biotin transporter BioY [Clostridia bacterium]